MAFQPKTAASAVQQLSDSENGFIYRADNASALGLYDLKDLIIVQTFLNFDANGVEKTTTQYFNTNKNIVIPFADFIASDFSLVAGGSSTTATVAAPMTMGYFVVPSLVDGAGNQNPFTLKQAIESVGGSFPSTAAYAKVQMQRRIGTENDYLLYTEDAQQVPVISPQFGQAETDWELTNIASISNTTFLAVPAVSGSTVNLCVTFWSSNPKN